MRLTVTYFEHLLDIAMTPAAAKVLEDSHHALYVDVRLYFGCLAKKAIVFDESFEPKEQYKINSKLFVRYQSLISNGCKIDGSETEYRLTPKQMGRLRWLKIDYKNGQWVGDFGLDDRYQGKDKETGTFSDLSPEANTVT